MNFRRFAHLLHLAPTGLLGAFWVLAPTVFGAGLLWYLGTAAEWLHAQPTAGWFIYITIFAVMSGLGFFPTTAQSVVGGWVFGFGWGLSGALMGVLGGATIGFVIARMVSAYKVEEFIDRFPKARLLRKTLLTRGAPKTTLVVALFRMPPHFPFALSNLLLSASGVPLKSFLVGTLLGMAPRLGVLSFFAAAAASGGSRDIQDFIKNGPGIWVALGGVAVLAVALAILGEIGRRALASATAQESSD
jgi:uncharacterized membrane protein YdjX (TVP38/TMEM64 family)